MACGQKKQNNSEGGVHLTERTCSPYNPIIKQIVDDCLGLPIYPVTSIDAVIDEEGNTLRKILENFIDYIKSDEFDQSDFESRLTELNNRITQLASQLSGLSDIYALKSELDSIQDDIAGLLSWIRLISKVDNMSSTDLQEQANPTIVTYIQQLRAQIETILENLGSSGELAQRIDSLEDLVEEIGKCGQNTLRTNGVIWIVKYVQQLLSDVQSIQDDISDLNDNIDGINETIADLTEAGNTHAHLDDTLLSQHVMKLEADEYPPTSFIVFPQNEADLYKFVNDVLGNMNHFFIYFPLGSKVAWTTGNNTIPFDYNDNGKIDLEDVLILMQDVLDGNTARNYTNYSTNKTYSRDVNGDQEVGLADINELIDILLGSTTDPNGEQTYSDNEWSSHIYEFTRKTGEQGDSIVFTNVEHLFPNFNVVVHPAIEGKVYTDLVTDYIYRYESLSSTTGRMHRIEQNNTAAYVSSISEALASETLKSGDNFICDQEIEVLARPALIGANITTTVNDTLTITDITASITYLLNSGFESPSTTQLYAYNQRWKAIKNMFISMRDENTAIVNDSSASQAQKTNAQAILDLLQEVYEEVCSTLNITEGQPDVTTIEEDWNNQTPIEGPTFNPGRFNPSNGGNSSSGGMTLFGAGNTFTATTSEVDVFIKVGNSFEKFTVYGRDNVERVANAVYDYNGDGLANISDVIEMIGTVATGSSQDLTAKRNPVSVGYNIYKKINSNSYKSLFSLYGENALAGRKFRIVNVPSTVDLDSNWVYFQGQEVTPTTKKYRLHYDKEAKEISLVASTNSVQGTVDLIEVLSKSLNIKMNSTGDLELRVGDTVISEVKHNDLFGEPQSADPNH